MLEVVAGTIIEGPRGRLITIPLSTEDLTKVRLSPSPLWETLTSFGALMRPEDHAVHAPWVSRARRALRGVDLSPMAAATGVGGRCPDYLSPPPDASRPSFGEELEVLRATPPEVVHAEVRALMREEGALLDRLPSERDRMLRVSEDPDGALRRLVDALGRYHELTIAPYWPRIRELLNRDVLRRAHALALGGPEALLSGLAPWVTLRGGSLELDGAREALVEPAGRGITLVPCAFSGPGVPVLTGPRYRPTLAYAPRGVARLWTSSPPAPNGSALGAALGAGRAAVLKGLAAPATTTGLARELRLSPATVSAHLSRLKAAGLVEPRRGGRKVYYHLSGAGESLLGVFGELP